MTEYETYRCVVSQPGLQVGLVLANNPGPMTLQGTNTWILATGTLPGESAATVIDPGPADETHLRAILDAAGEVETILLTHHHIDHTAGAATLQKLTGARVLAMDTARQPDSQPLWDGQVIESAGVRLVVMATPGHSSDSVSFVLDDGGEPQAVFTGDTILGDGTTVVAHPDGVLADYLQSLQRLAGLTQMPVLPGHGRIREEIGAAARFYLSHRQQRLDQVRAALEAGGPNQTARQIVETVYADVDPVLWNAAEKSVRAQLAYLRSSEVG